MNRERPEGHLDLMLVTDKGVAALAAQRTEWRRYAAGMQAVLGGSA